jgi:hypothetical protein
VLNLRQASVDVAFMRRTTHARTSRKHAWRSRSIIALAITGTVFMGAIAAAEIGARPGFRGDDALLKTIRAQRVAQGVPAQPPAAPVPTESTAGSEEQQRAAILAEAAQLEAQMNKAIAHVDTLRIEAYHEKNLLRMNFLKTKLDDMKAVATVLTPILAEIREPGQDLFVMRAKLSQVRQGVEQVRESAAAAESQQGEDSPDVLSIGSSNAEGQGSSQGDTDPTGPPSPTSDFTPINERPGEASPFK